VKFTKTFPVHYEAGHSYDETWATDGEMYCPHCGEQEVWIEQSGGDYYVGVPHFCTACEWKFYMPSLSERSGWQDEQRIAALSREGGGS
jgi:predicted RNA-binding Zn-ribbon protein involved in translation (DUF1610 family)